MLTVNDKIILGYSIPVFRFSLSFRQDNTANKRHRMESERHLTLQLRQSSHAGWRDGIIIITNLWLRWSFERSTGIHACSMPHWIRRLGSQPICGPLTCALLLATRSTLLQ